MTDNNFDIKLIQKKVNVWWELMSKKIKHLQILTFYNNFDLPRFNFKVTGSADNLKHFSTGKIKTVKMLNSKGKMGVLN